MNIYKVKCEDGWMNRVTEGRMDILKYELADIRTK